MPNRTILETRESYLGSNTYFEFFIAQDELTGPHLYWQLTSEYTGSTNIFEIYRNLDYGNPDSWELLDTVADVWFYHDTTLPKGIKDKVRIAYRVRLVRDNARLESPIAYLFPRPVGKERILAKAIVRKAFTEPWSLPHTSGKLLKRKYKGEKCSCVDNLTGEVTNSDCSICKGTGIVTGYWKAAVEYHIIHRNPLDSRPAFDINLFLGSVAPSEVVALGKAIPPPTIYDVWIPDNFNRRFYIVQTQTVAELRGFPILTALVLRMAEANDIIYSIDVS